MRNQVILISKIVVNDSIVHYLLTVLHILGSAVEGIYKFLYSYERPSDAKLAVSDFCFLLSSTKLWKKTLVAVS